MKTRWKGKADTQQAVGRLERVLKARDGAEAEAVGITAKECCFHSAEAARLGAELHLPR